MPGLDAAHLCEQYHHLVYKLAHSWVTKFPPQAVMDVEDLASEGFLELIKAAPKYRASRGAPSTFVSVVVRNRYYHLLTRQYDRWSRTVPLESASVLARSTPPEQDVLAALHDGIKAGRLVVNNRYRLLRLVDLECESPVEDHI